MYGKRPRLAVFKFASCDGCQLSLLDCEDELLSIADAVDIAYFLEATKTQLKGPYDLTLVEGSITTPEDAERIHQIRRQSKHLVSIGACATSGGIQALRNFEDVTDLAARVYPHPDTLKVLDNSMAISDHVRVDFELYGCPINKRQLLEVILAFVQDRKPNIPSAPVCMECKRRGIACVWVAHGTPCLGPVTHAGCGALCPAYRRGCFGCFGPSAGAEVTNLADQLVEIGIPSTEVSRLFRTFNANARDFRRESERRSAS